MTTSTVSVCARIAHRLAESVGPRRYSMWFDRTAKLEYDDHQRRLEVAVPNRFVADWIGRHFDGELRRAAQRELGEPVDLAVRVSPERFGDDTRPAPAKAAATPAPHRPKRHKTPAPTFDAQHTARHSLEEFIVGPSNELAYAAACRLCEDDSATSPLFIHGGCGLGKTHLLQGICRRMLERNPQARVLYTTGEQFTNEFLAAVRINRVEEFRRKVRRLDLLAVDDVHFIANKQATQQEFLHSFDAIELCGARVVLASDSHPKLINQFSEALVSRCVRGMVVEVRPPDTATRARLVRALAERRGIPLMDTVIEVLAARCLGSVREIEGTLAKLHALATLTGQRRGGASAPGAVGPGGGEGHATAHAAPAPPAPGAEPEAGSGAPSPSAGDAAASMRPASGVAQPIGHALLNHLFDGETDHAPRRAVRFESIVTVVSEQLAVPRAQIMANGRHQNVVLARSLVIHLARRLTPMSYPEIAAAMGRKTHSTIITAAQRIEKQLGDPKPIVLPAVGETTLTDLLHRLKQAIQRA